MPPCLFTPLPPCYCSVALAPNVAPHTRAAVPPSTISNRKHVIAPPSLYESPAICHMNYYNVASQLAQQKEFNLKKPSAYHYDILLLGFMACFCLKHRFLNLIRRNMVKSAKESIKQKSSKSEIYENLQVVFIEMDSTQDVEAEKLHIIDKDCIEKGIVELICKHNIKKLMMGAASDKYHSSEL
ncbi:hypothetical protein Ahy_A05g024052 [Arachis hypogaea]|uniref:Uncharacterized protein n=1 Tax=Arachis hypogaea TaxID=3818 RepID=A0A445D548_ARAHY|nr:hypothetical protein Ahy_A05g024052 [Arachis hypogaea]